MYFFFKKINKFVFTENYFKTSDVSYSGPPFNASLSN